MSFIFPVRILFITVQQLYVLHCIAYYINPILFKMKYVLWNSARSTNVFCNPVDTTMIVWFWWVPNCTLILLEGPLFCCVRNNRQRSVSMFKYRTVTEVLNLHLYLQYQVKIPKRVSGRFRKWNKIHIHIIKKYKVNEIRD